MCLDRKNVPQHAEEKRDYPQDHLIQCAKSLGYEISVAGMCFGLTSMAKDAALAKCQKQFVDRLALLEKLISLAKINATEQFAKLPSNEVKKHDNRLVADYYKKLKEEADYIKFNEIWRSTILGHLEKLPSQSLIDIKAFFDGVIIYQNPHQYPHLFPKKHLTPKGQDPELVQPLVVSHALKNQGGANQLNTFFGLYDEESLIIYFDTLFQHLKKSDRPMALQISNAGHIISITYNPETKAMLVVAPNHLPPVITQDVAVIAKIILREFPKNKNVILLTNVYAASSDEVIVKPCVGAWRQDPIFVNLHQITKKNVNVVDGTGISQLFMAVNMGDVKKIDELLAKGALPNMQHKYQGITALYLAIDKNPNDFEVIEKLIKAGADPRILSDPTDPWSSPLELAKKRKAHPAIINYLDQTAEYLDKLQKRYGGLFCLFAKAPVLVVPEEKHKKQTGFQK